MDDSKQPPAPVKSKGGRPRVVERGVIVSTWLPTADYDHIIKVAARHDVSISAVVRAWIRKQLK